jgi:hypothetical protein
MPIDPRIAMGFQTPQPMDVMQTYGNVMKLRGLQQQNALVDQQMADAERQRVAANALSEAYRTAYNPQTGELNYNALAGNLAQSGQGAAIPGLFKSRDEALKARYESVDSYNKALIQEGNLFKTQLQQLDPSDPNAPTLMAQFIRGHHAPGSLTAELLKRQGISPEQSLSALDNAVKTGKFGDFLARSQLGADEWIKRNTLTANEQSMAEDRRVQRDIARGNLDVSRGQLRVAEERLAFDQGKQKTELPPAEAARQRVLGETQAKFEVAAPQAIEDATSAIKLIDQMIGTRPRIDKNTGERVQDVAPHPGFSWAVGAGISGERLPGSPQADFEALLKQIQGGAFLQAYETLRGGGAITQTEGEKATAARNRMSTAQSEDGFIKAAREYQDILRAAIKRAESRAAGGTGAPPASLPANAAAELKEGFNTTFSNGQTWTLRNGQPVQVK